MRNSSLVLLLAALVPTATGCGSGALNQSVMMGECGPHDQSCWAAGLDAPIAVGAELRPEVRMGLRGSATPEIRVRSVAPDVIDAHDGVLTAKAPGVAAIMMTMPDGTVMDFNHLWVAQPTRMELHALTPDGSDRGHVRGTVELVAGESLRLEPRAYAHDQRLLGRAEVEWTVQPPILTVLQEGVPDRRRLVAHMPGKATLTASAMGLQSSLELVVHRTVRGPDVVAIDGPDPAPSPASASGTAEAAASADITQEVVR